jgi:gamma-glutamyltranspeptidase/glutathione hydrolase
MIEAKKLAFEDRARWYADPDFFATPVERLISKSYAAERRARIDLRRAAASYPPGEMPGDTVYLCTADAERNMVSLIQSNYRGFGSGLCPDGLGFCLQNRGEMFALEADHPNVYAPHKRPFHTIIPAFVTRDGQPVMAFGVMGGDMQPQGHVQILCNIIDFGMNLQEAGDAARWYHTGSTEPTDPQLTAAAATATPASAPIAASGAVQTQPRPAGPMRDGGVIALESGIGDEVRRELERRGHRIGSAPGAFGGYQAIAYDALSGVYRAASESRKDGCAAGY